MATETTEPPRRPGLRELLSAAVLTLVVVLGFWGGTLPALPDPLPLAAAVAAGLLAGGASAAARRAGVRLFPGSTLGLFAVIAAAVLVSLVFLPRDAGVGVLVEFALLVGIWADALLAVYDHSTSNER